MRRGGYIGLLICMLTIPFLLDSGKGLHVDKPSLEIGEYWEYKLYSTYKTYSKTAHIKISVKGIEPFILNGREINAIVLELVRNGTIVVGENITREDKYMKEYLDNDLSVFRIEETDLQTGRCKIYEYDPPIGLDWPLVVNKSWLRNSQVKIFEGGNLSLRNATFSYSCTHEEIVHTDAGTFDCIAVERVINGDYLNRTVRYYSPDAGYSYVKIERYWMGGIAIVTELVSHGIEKKEEKENQGGVGIPDFDIGVVMVSLILATTGVTMIRRFRH